MRSAQDDNSVRYKSARRRRQNHFGRRPQVPDDSAGQNQTNGDQLGAAQYSSKYGAAAGIITQKLDKESRDPVQEQIGAENLSVEFLALEHPGQDEEDAKLGGRFKELSWLQRLA